MPQPPALKPIGFPLIELQSVDSTNNYARELIRQHSLPERQPDSLHGTAVFAHEQWAGKGQRGKQWSAQKNANITLSIILDPAPLRVADQFSLSVCMALGMCYFFKEYAGDETRIKWPNDLYWRDRKAGGLLIENVITNSGPGEAQWRWAIAGMGININQVGFPADLKNPVSLKQITGKEFSPLELSRELCAAIDPCFTQLMTHGINALFDEYLAHLYKINERVRLKRDQAVFEATIKGVSPGGKLLVHHSIDEEFEFGTIEWMI